MTSMVHAQVQDDRPSISSNTAPYRVLGYDTRALGQLNARHCEESRDQWDAESRLTMYSELHTLVSTAPNAVSRKPWLLKYTLRAAGQDISGKGIARDSGRDMNHDLT